MAIYETFSKRQKKLSKQGESDPYRYDIFPGPLRVQVIKLLIEGLCNYNRGYNNRDDGLHPGGNAYMKPSHMNMECSNSPRGEMHNSNVFRFS